MKNTFNFTTTSLLHTRPRPATAAAAPPHHRHRHPAPVAAAPLPAMKGTWRSGLFDCGNTEPDAVEVCLCGVFCHSCVFGESCRSRPTAAETAPLGAFTRRS